MGDAIVDDVKRVLSEADKKPKCPKCGSRRMFVTYSRLFRVDLDEDSSEDTMGSSLDPQRIACAECDCGETIYEE